MGKMGSKAGYFEPAVVSKCKITAVVNVAGRYVIDIRDLKPIPELHPQEAALKCVLQNVTSSLGEQQPLRGWLGRAC